MWNQRGVTSRWGVSAKCLHCKLWLVWVSVHIVRICGLFDQFLLPQYDAIRSHKSCVVALSLPPSHLSLRCPCKGGANSQFTQGCVITAETAVMTVELWMTVPLTLFTTHGLPKVHCDGSDLTVHMARCHYWTISTHSLGTGTALGCRQSWLLPWVQMYWSLFEYAVIDFSHRDTPINPCCSLK